MAVTRMDNVLIVVEDLEAVKAFFIELGLKLVGETTVEGPLVGSLIWLKDVRATLAMLRPPDGHVGIEPDKFHTPNAIRYGPVGRPVNALGIRRVMFDVDDIDDAVARIRAHGAELIGEMQYEDASRLAYIRGPEGIIVGLAEEIQEASPRTGGGGVGVRKKADDLKIRSWGISFPAAHTRSGAVSPPERRHFVLRARVLVLAGGF